MPDMTIADAGRLLDSGQISAVELLEETLARAATLNPRLGAICTLIEDGAREAARRSDRRIAAGEREGPLDGIPLHIKDNIHLGGITCQWGSQLYRDFVPDQDDQPVARLVSAGAVLFGKTNTPEFALSGTTDNLLHGPSRNPYDLGRTPGGSSGGAVAATAAAIGFGGLCTDAGGSIRRPAGYAGVYGLRPSVGAVDRRGGFPLTVNDFQTVGPVARTLEDVALLFSAIRSRPPVAAPFTPGADRASISIDLILHSEDHAIDPFVERATRDAAKALRTAGYEVAERSPPWSRQEVEHAFGTLSAAGAARICAAHDPSTWSEMATPPMQALARRGQELSAVAYVEALDIVALLRDASRCWFAGPRLWLMPTSPCTAWPLGSEQPALIAGGPVRPRDAAVYGPIVNALGAAGLAIPAGLDWDGLPIGIQLVAGRGEEDLALTVARDLVAAIGTIAPPKLTGLL